MKGSVIDIGLGLDATLNLSFADQAALAQEAAQLGYTSLWTPEGAGQDAFQLCVHLWQMPAEDLVALDQPALLALVGQTRLDRPAVVLPAIVARLRQVTDAEARGRLLTVLLALLPQGEMVTMVEKLLEDETLLLDTPSLHRIREEGREEGRLAARRRSIVDALTLRFTPPAATVQQVSQYVETLTDEAALERLFAAAIRSTNLTEFQAAMTQA